MILPATAKNLVISALLAIPSALLFASGSNAFQSDTLYRPGGKVNDAGTSYRAQILYGTVVAHRRLQGGKGELVLARRDGELLSVIQARSASIQLGSRVSVTADPIACSTAKQGVCFFTSQRQPRFTGADATRVRVIAYVWNASGSQLSFSSVGTAVQNGQLHIRVDVAGSTRQAASNVVGSVASLTLARAQRLGRFDFGWIVVGVG